jgi:hypothetical protein
MTTAVAGTVITAVIETETGTATTATEIATIAHQSSTSLACV